MMKIPTQKGEHSCKCTELSLKRKEGIGYTVYIKGLVLNKVELHLLSREVSTALHVTRFIR